MKKVIKLSESDLSRLIKKIVKEQSSTPPSTGFVESTNISGLENKKGTWSATDTQVTLFNDQNQPVYEIRLKGYTDNDI